MLLQCFLCSFRLFGKLQHTQTMIVHVGKIDVLLILQVCCRGAPANAFAMSTVFVLSHFTPVSTTGAAGDRLKAAKTHSSFWFFEMPAAGHSS